MCDAMEMERCDGRLIWERSMVRNPSWNRPSVGEEIGKRGEAEV